MIKTSVARACLLSSLLPLGLAALAVGGCAKTVKPEKSAATPVSPAPWASAHNPLAANPEMEAKITDIMRRLTLEEKVGQMIQPHIGAVTLEEVKRYNIGSILNGGGQTPNDNADAKADDWVKMAEAFYQASMSTENGRTAIPIFWGIDAVHGHSNLIGATLFPHNIALGATRNAALVKALGTVTANEVSATGQDWDFAPTVAVAQDDRWGRTYESFSEDPALTATLSGKMVEGLQGLANTPEFLDSRHVLATAKHFIGDGGTTNGDDQGFTEGDEAQLLKTHLPGYIAAINAGVQTVMASYSSWNGVHSHANKKLLTDLLKGQLGFDGLVVSDWQAIPHIPGCTSDNCPEAVNAGVDLFMIPNNPEWKTFHSNVVAQVKSGVISQARIDDAVRRILRVKLRADLYNKPGPVARATAAKGTIGSAANRALARQAARESLVLLKNTQSILPISPKSKILIAGPGANSISMQAGGWSVTWRGNDLPNSKFPGATSIYAGFEQAVKAAGGRNIEFSESGEFKQKPNVAVVVFGEVPYAEMFGDIQNTNTLEVEKDTKASLALIKKLKAKGIPVVAVLLSGRPLYVNKELNAADAFVAAWQPGTEGAGVADVLIAKADGKPNYDFAGRLSFSWPKTPCQTPLNKGDANYDPLFPFDFGLNYASSLTPWQPLTEDTSAYLYGCHLGNTLPTVAGSRFTAENGWNWYAEQPSYNRKPVSTAGSVTQGPLTASANTEGVVTANWNGQSLAKLIVRNSGNNLRHNLLPIYAQQGALVLDVKLSEPFKGRLDAAVFSGALTFSLVNISPIMATLPANTWKTVSVDLACFGKDHSDFSKVDGPIALQTGDALKLEVRNPRYDIGVAKTASISCSQ